jgi:hypothetical protein
MLSEIFQSEFIDPLKSDIELLKISPMFSLGHVKDMNLNVLN